MTVNPVPHTDDPNVDAPAKRVAHNRGKLAALSRSRNAADPELVGTRDALREAMIEKRVADAIASAVAARPPLTPETRDRIARLLTAEAEEMATA